MRNKILYGRFKWNNTLNLIDILNYYDEINNIKYVNNLNVKKEINKIIKKIKKK